MVRMNKEQKIVIIAITANEQRIKRRNFFFKAKEHHALVIVGDNEQTT
jgi:hypothetical protein